MACIECVFVPEKESTGVHFPCVLWRLLQRRWWSWNELNQLGRFLCHQALEFLSQQQVKVNG